MNESAPAAGSDELLRLVLRAQGRDCEAFAALYRAQVGAVSRYVGAIVRHRESAEDAVGQTFLLAWRDLAALRKPERFEAWLFRIAHNQAIEALKGRSTTPLDELAEEPPDEGTFRSPAEVLERHTDVQWLRRGLLRLPEEQRAVLILRFLCARSHAEVAQQLGKSEEAVRALQHRALERMRREMPRVEAESA